MANNMILSEQFGISPLVEPGVIEHMVGSSALLPPQKAEPPPNIEAIVHDFNTARENVLEVIENSRNAITSLADLSEQSQDNKYYDSLSGILKVMLEANRDLLDAHIKIQKLSENIGGVVKNVQNNLFVGSTAELQRILNDLQKNKSV